ncbi:MAG: universal stress protein [Alphaproteobacteria bacterium]|nr:universal stress protein [Alphaproteobacteria bacterium]
MSKKILVAYDGSRGSEKTIDVAASLAGGNGSEVWLLCAYSYENVPPAFRSFAEAEGVNDPAEHLYYRYLVDHVMTPARERLKKAGVAKVEVALQQGDAAEVIVDFAKEKVVDTIVIGSRGLSDLEGLVFGSVSHKVNHNAPCTCVTVR